MKATDFDAKFDAGEDVVELLDVARARRPDASRRVNVALPAWMVESLDIEAARLGLSRQAIIKAWIAERLKRTA